tara:strand:- start:422 stop:811 length:390 start_codon:yes stop_codon:yes gene_type:complete
MQEILQQLKNNRLSITEVDKSLLENYDFMLEAVRIDGYNLMMASNELKANFKIVMEAVKQNGLALQYASFRLSYNLEIVLEAVKADGVAIKYASNLIIYQVIYDLGHDKMIKFLEKKVENSSKVENSNK